MNLEIAPRALAIGWSRSRPTRKRPLSISLCAMLYLLAPLLMPLQALLFPHAPHATLAEEIGRPSTNSLLVMISCWIVAWGVYRMRPWGWYLLILHSLAIMLNNVHVYRHVPAYPSSLMLLSEAALLAVAVLFLTRPIRAPYFNPRLRWRDGATRVRVNFPTAIFAANHAREGETLDISEAGAFVACDNRAIELGGRHSLMVSLPGMTLSCEAEVMWKADPTGVGLRFVGVPRAQRRRVRALVRRLGRTTF
jgi:hypothetical protein